MSTAGTPAYEITYGPSERQTMAGRIGGILKTGAKTGGKVATNLLATNIRSATALRPTSAWELGSVLGGVAGVFVAVVFDLPTDTALLVIFGLAIAGALVVGFVLPTVWKTAPLLALA